MSGALPWSTARCSIVLLARPSPRGCEAFDRVRTLPASSTTPSRTSMTGLIDSIDAEQRLRVADAAALAEVLERVEGREEPGAVAAVDDLGDDRLERVAVGGAPRRR